MVKTPKTVPLRHLQRALKILGSQSAIARAIGIRQQTVSEVFLDGRQAPAKWCIPLERATDGKVTRHELRPDLYPEPAPRKLAEVSE
jgi:DNA-binding transcriptional regulator YdaS (Cro superfamily)